MSKHDENLLVNLFLSPEFDHAGRQGDHDGLRPCETAVRVLRMQRAEIEQLRAALLVARQRQAEDAETIAGLAVKAADARTVLLAEREEWITFWDRMHPAGSPPMSPQEKRLMREIFIKDGE